MFLGFALAGAQGFSIPAFVVALGAFGLGALGGGRLGSAMSRRRSTLLSATDAVQVVFLAAGVVMAALAGSPVPPGYRYGLIVALGISMGVQNATAWRLAVPDLTTTVPTLTIVGVAADSDMAYGGGSGAGRRLISVTVMLAGALVGAALVVHVQIVYPLVIALVAVAIVAVTTRALRRPAPVCRRRIPQEPRRHQLDHPLARAGRRPCWPATSATAGSSAPSPSRPAPG